MEHNAQIQNFLNSVGQQIEDLLKPDLQFWRRSPEPMLSAARHICLSGGAKRARPRLLYLFGQAVQALTPGLRDMSVAVELIHTASLLHDDVVDQGTLRRGRPTVNAHWSNTVAVLTGDLMLSLALQQLQGYAPQITVEAIDVVSEMTRASMLEVQLRGDIELTQELWERVAEGKTGVLFAWCGRAAARLASDEEALVCFDKCGRHMGLAFQMADDLKDLQGKELGKNLFADILNQNPSYALLQAFEASPALQRDMMQAWSNKSLELREVESLGQAVLDTGAAERTKDAIGHHVTNAIESLGHYKERPGGRDIAQWADVLWRGL